MNELTAQRDSVRAMLARFFEPAVADQLLALTRPAVRLAGEDLGGVRLKGSHLGGLPTVTSWPTWQERPLSFLGVLDLAELAAWVDLPALPAVGFFHATDTPWPWGLTPEEADGWRVVSMRDGPLSCPPSGTTVFAEQPLYATPMLSLPGPLEPLMSGSDDFNEIYEHVYWAWKRTVWPAGRPCHQVGGWPVLAQRSLWVECAKASAGHDVGPLSAVATPQQARAAERDWRLLLQLHNDATMGWRWGDTGAVYFLARRHDLSAGAVDRSWAMLQSR